MTDQTYFRKGFGLRSEIAGDLAADYHSRLVDRIRASGHVLTVGELTFLLATLRALLHVPDGRRVEPER